MFNKIVDLILKSEYRIDGNTIFISNYKIIDVELIDFLEENNILESPILNKSKGTMTNLELSLTYLNSLGFFSIKEEFLLKFKYEESSDDFYILDLNIYKSSRSEFLTNYRSITKLIAAIRSCSKHIFSELGIDNCILYSESKSLIFPLIYDAFTLDKLRADLVSLINEFTSVLAGNNSEKKLIFLNELHDFLLTIEEEKRFGYLISNFETYFENCNNSFQYYLRDFSFNKLKLELDGKALEYTQKIQGVINDSQTKLVAIPTAFVLVFSSFEFSDLFSIKNIVSILSLFIFAVILQLFLNNQFSILNFLSENIDSYKKTFKETNIEIISSKFNLLEVELKKQRYRFLIVQWILWLLPIGLLILWGCLIYKYGINNLETDPVKNFFTKS